MAHTPGKKSAGHVHPAGSHRSSTSSPTSSVRRSSTTADAPKGETGSASHKLDMITASPEAMRNRGRSRGPNGWVGASERANSPLAPKHNQTIDGVAVVTDKDDSNAPPKEGVVPRKGSLLDQVFGSIARKGSTSSHMGTRKGSAADSLASDTLASDPQNCTLGPSPYIVPQKVGRDSAKRVHNNHAGTTQRAPEDSPPASQPSSSVQPATNNTLKPPATPGLTKSSDGLLYKTPSPRHGSTLKVGTDGLSRLTPGTPRTRHTDGIPRRTPATRGATPATSGTTSTRTPFKNVVQKEDKELKSSDKVGGLRIYLDPPDRDPVGDVTASPSELPKGLMNPARKGSAEYEIPARWIHLALRMLEHPIGLDVLVEGAFHYVQHKKEAGQFDKLIYDREEDQLQNTAREFLEKVRDNFFNVFITKGLDYESRAETERMSWPKILKDNLKYTLRKDNRGIRLEDYDPKYGAVIYINDLTIEAMLHQSEAIQKAKEEKNMKAEENARQCYDITTWYGVITMVHEIYHCWFGFLTGDDAVFTPRLMNFPFPALSYEETQTVRTDTVNRGESGHWCEGRLFAGRPLMLEDPGNPLNSYQSGIPKLWQETGLFFDVCPNFIKNVINGDVFLWGIKGGLGDIRDQARKYISNTAEELTKFRGLPEMRREIDLERLRAKSNPRRKSSGATLFNKPPKEPNLMTVDELKAWNKKPSETFVWNGPLDPLSLRTERKRAGVVPRGKTQWNAGYQER